MVVFKEAANNKDANKKSKSRDDGDKRKAENEKRADGNGQLSGSKTKSKKTNGNHVLHNGPRSLNQQRSDPLDPYAFTEEDNTISTTTPAASVNECNLSESSSSDSDSSSDSSSSSSSSSDSSDSESG